MVVSLQCLNVNHWIGTRHVLRGVTARFEASTAVVGGEGIFECLLSSHPRILVNGHRAQVKPLVTWARPLLEEFTVKELVYYSAMLCGTRLARADEIAADFGLSHLYSRTIGDMSHGEKKNLAIGIEALSKRSIFFGRENVERATLRAMASRKLNAIVSLTRHDALDEYDRVLVLQNGLVVFHGPPTQMQSYFSSTLATALDSKEWPSFEAILPTTEKSPLPPAQVLNVSWKRQYAILFLIHAHLALEENPLILLSASIALVLSPRRAFVVLLVAATSSTLGSPSKHFHRVVKYDVANGLYPLSAYWCARATIVLLVSAFFSAFAASFLSLSPTVSKEIYFTVFTLYVATSILVGMSISTLFDSRRLAAGAHLALVFAIASFATATIDYSWWNSIFLLVPRESGYRDRLLAQLAQLFFSASASYVAMFYASSDHAPIKETTGEEKRKSISVDVEGGCSKKHSYGSSSDTTRVVEVSVRDLYFWPSATPTVETLRNVNVTFRAATSTALVGPSGSGKSTLLGVLAKSVAGSYRGSVLPKRRRLLVSYTPPDLTQASLTIHETLMHRSRLLRDNPRRLYNLEKQFGLDSRDDSPESRRIASLVLNLLSDRPVVLVDNSTRLASTALRSLLRVALNERKTLVFALVNPSSTEELMLFDNTVAMCKGRVAYSGSPHELGTFFETCRSNESLSGSARTGNVAEYAVQMLSGNDDGDFWPNKWELFVEIHSKQQRKRLASSFAASKDLPDADALATRWLQYTLWTRRALSTFRKEFFSALLSCFCGATLCAMTRGDSYFASALASLLPALASVYVSAVVVPTHSGYAIREICSGLCTPSPVWMGLLTAASLATILLASSTVLYWWWLVSAPFEAWRLAWAILSSWLCAISYFTLVAVIGTTTKRSVRAAHAALVVSILVVLDAAFVVSAIHRNESAAAAGDLQTPFRRTLALLIPNSSYSVILCCFWGRDQATTMTRNSSISSFLLSPNNARRTSLLRDTNVALALDFLLLALFGLVCAEYGLKRRYCSRRRKRG